MIRSCSHNNAINKLGNPKNIDSIKSIRYTLGVNSLLRPHDSVSNTSRSRTAYRTAYIAPYIWHPDASIQTIAHGFKTSRATKLGTLNNCKQTLQNKIDSVEIGLE